MISWFQSFRKIRNWNHKSHENTQKDTKHAEKRFNFKLNQCLPTVVVGAEVITPAFFVVVFKDRDGAFEYDLGVEFSPEAISSPRRGANREDYAFITNGRNRRRSPVFF